MLSVHWITGYFLHRAYSVFTLFLRHSHRDDVHINAQSPYILYIKMYSFFFLISNLNTETCRLSDCHSSHTELQHSRDSQVAWINKQNNSSCRWICFCPYLMCFLPPMSQCDFSSSIITYCMCIIYIIDCSPSAGLIFKAALRRFTCWNGCKSNSDESTVMNVIITRLDTRKCHFFTNWDSFNYHSYRFWSWFLTS